jgi:hypothetical protein
MRPGRRLTIAEEADGGLCGAPGLRRLPPLQQLVGLPAVRLAQRRVQLRVSPPARPVSAAAGQETTVITRSSLTSTTHTGEQRQVAYSDEKAANRDTKVWHGATDNGP